MNRRANWIVNMHLMILAMSRCSKLHLSCEGRTNVSHRPLLSRLFPATLPDEHWQPQRSSFEAAAATLPYHHHLNTTPPSHTTANMLASRVAARSARVAAPRFQAVSSRGFAEAAKVDAKPPVPLFGVDGTYASALVCNRRMLWEHGKIEATGN